MNLSKCHFLKEEINYLGHCIKYNEISPIYDNISSIIKIKPPTDVKQVRQFLGKINYYHRFIDKVSSLLSPLHQLLKKDQKFEWTTECQETFDKLKVIITSQPVLAIFNPNERCILETDASKLGLGAVLKQKGSDEQLHPIGYFSKKLTKHQQNYSITELECLAVIEAIKFWHYYLYGNLFTIITDHSALKSILKFKNPSSRLFVWSLFLSQYKFEINYRPGKLNVEADYLSRNPNDISENKTKIPIMNFLTLEMISLHQQSMDINALSSDYFRENSVIFRRMANQTKKIVVPEQLRSVFIR